MFSRNHQSSCSTAIAHSGVCAGRRAAVPGAKVLVFAKPSWKLHVWNPAPSAFSSGLDPPARGTKPPSGRSVCFQRGVREKETERVPENDNLLSLELPLSSGSSFGPRKNRLLVENCVANVNLPAFWAHTRSACAAYPSGFRYSGQNLLARNCPSGGRGGRRNQSRCQRGGLAEEWRPELGLWPRMGEQTSLGPGKARQCALDSVFRVAHPALLAENMVRPDEILRELAECLHEPEARNARCALFCAYESRKTGLSPVAGPVSGSSGRDGALGICALRRENFRLAPQRGSGPLECSWRRAVETVRTPKESEAPGTAVRWGVGNNFVYRGECHLPNEVFGATGSCFAGLPPPPPARHKSRKPGACSMRPRLLLVPPSGFAAKALWSKLGPGRRYGRSSRCCCPSGQPLALVTARFS